MFHGLECHRDLAYMSAVRGLLNAYAQMADRGKTRFPDRTKRIELEMRRALGGDDF